MKHPRSKHMAILSSLLAVLLGLVGWPVWQEAKQQQVNHKLLEAIQQDNDVQALAALRAGASPNTREGEPNLSAWTVLRRRLQTIEHSLPARSFQGETVLMYAADRSSLSIVNALLSSGADVNAVDEQERTALCFAIKEKTANLEIIHVLLAKGANVNQPIYKTPLMMAAWANQPDLVQLLLDRGAQVNAFSPANGTILYSLKHAGLSAKATAEQHRRYVRILAILKKAGALQKEGEKNLDE